MGDSSKTAPVTVDQVEAHAKRPWADAEFRAVYERHAGEVLRFAIRYTGRREIAEELASEAFLKMYQQGNQIDPDRAAAWLTTAVRNLAIDYWRRVQTERKHHAVSRPMVFPPDVAPSITWEEILAQPALNGDHRTCLTLHYVHGMDRKEISSHTGLTGNQVKSCLQYGLKLLRDAFGARGK